MYSIKAKIGAFFLKTFTMYSPYLSHYGQNRSLCKIGIQINTSNFTPKEKNWSSKKTSATKQSPPSDVYYMEFYRNVLIEYSLIGIVKPTFNRRHEIPYNCFFCGCIFLQFLRVVSKTSTYNFSHRENPIFILQKIWKIFMATLNTRLAYLS